MEEYAKVWDAIDILIEDGLDPPDMFIFSNPDKKKLAEEIAKIIIRNLEDYMINGESEAYPKGFLNKKGD